MTKNGNNKGPLVYIDHFPNDENTVYKIMGNLRVLLYSCCKPLIRMSEKGSQTGCYVLELKGDKEY